MNIIEAYIKFKGQLVILISGMSGSGVTKLAQNIERDFKLYNINCKKYYKPDYNNKIKLSTGQEIINWDTDDVIDWDKLNSEINKHKSTGVVISGTSFPNNKIDFVADFHIHIKLSKENLVDKRREFLKDHKEDFEDQIKYINTPVESIIMNQYTYPYYLKTITESTINKFINANTIIANKSNYYETIYNEVFEYLISFIEKWVNKYNENLIQGPKLQMSHEVKPMYNGIKIPYNAVKKPYTKKQIQNDSSSRIDDSDDVDDTPDNIPLKFLTRGVY